MSVTRSEQASAKYKEALKLLQHGDCFMCDNTPAAKYEHWCLTPSAYPYDLLAKTHLLLYPVRHVANRTDLTEDEVDELMVILDNIENGDKFDAILENFKKSKSVPGHFHLHLLEYK